MSGSYDDLNLWKTAVRQVTPLRTKKPTSTIKPKEQPKPPDKKQKSILNLKPHSAPIKSAPDLKISSLADIDKNQRQRMDSGNLPIEATLDLHGLYRQEAFTEFTTFIERAYAQNKRMLLIITGKGYKSPQNKAVLKADLPHWLNHVGIREKVLRFSPAQPKHGGDGAFYILLKRVRS